MYRRKSRLLRFGNLWWLLPPAAALFYPQAVRALYESGKLLHRANRPGEAAAWLATIVSVGLIYGVPAASVGAAYLQSSFWAVRSPRWTRPFCGRPALQWASCPMHGT